VGINSPAFFVSSHIARFCKKTSLGKSSSGIVYTNSLVM